MKTQLLSLLAATALIAAGCSHQARVENTSQEFNALPLAVQKAVRSHAPNAEIASVDSKTRDGLKYYEIEFKEPGVNPKMTVAYDGSLVRTDADKAMGSSIGAAGATTGRSAKIDLSALPLAVQKALKSEVPNAELDGISSKNVDGRMIYEFEFKDAGKNPTMRIADDGTVVQTLKK